MERTKKHSVEILLVGYVTVGLCALTNTIVGHVILPEQGMESFDGSHKQKRRVLFSGLQVRYFGVNFISWYPDQCEDVPFFANEANSADLIIYCESMIGGVVKNAISCLDCKHWEKAIVVLTYANKFSQTNVKHFRNYLDSYKKKIHDALKRADIDREILEAIPIVPAGYDPDTPLPDCENWLSRLWYACLSRMNKRVQSSFLRASLHFDAKIVAGIKLETLPAQLAAEFKDLIQQAQVDQDSEKLLDKAMEFGYVLCRSIVLLLIGAAGAGKTSVKHLLLNQSLPKHRESTPLAKSAIRAISVSKATVADKGLDWQAVTPSELEGVLAGGMIDGVIGMESSVALELSHTNRLKLVEVDDNDTVVESEESCRRSETAKPKIDLLGFNKVLSHSTQSGHNTLMARLRQEYLSHMSKSPASTKLLEVDWIYIIDSGGQPQYHELLSTAVKHISGAVLFVKLNEELDSRPTVEYYAKGGKEIGEPYVSSLTHKEIIGSCLQVIQSRQGISEDDSLKLFVVGTHRDRESECTESGEEKNQWFLDKCLPHDLLQKQLICYRSGDPDEVVFPVNARTPSHSDYAVVESFRKAVTNNCSKTEVKIPIAWFMLERLLQMLSESKRSKVLTLHECVEQGQSVKMKTRDVIGAINYLTKHNIFMYFPDQLPNVVFSSSQVILDKISELVEHSHALRGNSSAGARVQTGTNSDSREFRDRGIVSIQLLQQFPKHYISGLFSAKDLLMLLEVLLIIARLPKGEYFMPSVLLTEDLQSLCNHIDSEVSPMLVYYPGGWLPYGFFNALMAYLLNTSQWKVCENRGKPKCLYKNCAMFKIPEKGIVMLMDSLSHLEVHAQLRDLNDCHYVRTEICQGLAKVADVKNYVDLPSAEVGFICQGPQISTDGISHDSSRHLAVVESNKAWWTCSLQDHVYGKLTSKQLPWLEVSAGATPLGARLCTAADTVDGLSAMLAQKTLSAVGTESVQQTMSAPLYRMRPTTKDFNVIHWRNQTGEVQSYRLCENVSYEWRKLGQILGYPEGFLKSTAIAHRGHTESCWNDIVTRWLSDGSEPLEAYPVTWRGLVSALEHVGGFRAELMRLCRALENRVS